MEFTFGIVTDGNSIERIKKIINDIRNQEIPNSQIIVVGGQEIEGIDWISFDETIKPKWITKKKNLITQHAKYENIVFMHDYVTLLPEWYLGMELFGNDWDICMTQIINSNNERYRDWCIWADKDYILNDSYNNEPGVKSNIIKRILPPYTYNKTQNMYISGAYFIVKKYVMEKYPLDESLVWGQGEDVKWSGQVLLEEGYTYKMNIHSKAKLLKRKDRAAELLDNISLK